MIKMHKNREKEARLKIGRKIGNRRGERGKRTLNVFKK